MIDGVGEDSKIKGQIFLINKHPLDLDSLI